MPKIVFRPCQYWSDPTWFLVEDVLVVEDGVVGLHEPPGHLGRRGVEDEVRELSNVLPVAVVVEVVALASLQSQFLGILAGLGQVDLQTRALTISQSLHYLGPKYLPRCPPSPSPPSARCNTNSS